MISLIMPFYGRYDLVHQRLWELWQHIPREDFEILLINDCSPEKKDYEGNIAWWQGILHNSVSNPHKIRYHENKTNLGFGGAMNLGAKHADGDLLIFFSDDVIIAGNFLPEVKGKFERDSRILLGGEIVNFPGGWNEFDVKGQHFYIPYCNGWFLCATKETWEESGGFDPIYYPFDYEDLDISTRYLEMGCDLYALNSNLLHHMGGVSIVSAGFDRSKYTREHRELYIKKWGDKLLDIHRVASEKVHEK